MNNGKRLPAKVIWLSLLSFLASVSISECQEYLPPKTGGGKKKKDDDEASGPAKYSYSYEVQDGNENVDFAHNEERDGDTVKGSYHVLLPDGRTQKVDYEAGPNGYDAKVSYEGEASFPPTEKKEGKFDGYRYYAASARRNYIRRPAKGDGSDASGRLLGGTIIVEDNEIVDEDEDDE